MNGKKVYLGLFTAAVIYSLSFWDLIDAKTYEYLMTLDLLVTGGAVRHTLSKIEK